MDASIEVDVAIDAAVDAAIDAPVDAAIDAAIDAPAPSLSPSCASTPQVLVNASPRRLNNIATIGDVLYYSAHHWEQGMTVTNTTVEAISLTTETAAAASLVTDGATWLTPAGDAVIATSSSEVWMLRNGEATVRVISGRTAMRMATTDGTYVYWSEAGTNPSDPVYRRLLGGGAVEVVTSCPQPSQLLIKDGTLYCASGDGNVYYSPLTGGAIQAIPKNGTSSIAAMGARLEENTLFHTNLLGEIWAAPLPAGPATKVFAHTMPTPRFMGLALTSDYFYVAGTHTLRIHRTTKQVQTIASDESAGDPIIWNNDLYFMASSFTDAAYRRVLHCTN